MIPDALHSRVALVNAGCRQAGMTSKEVYSTFYETKNCKSVSNAVVMTFRYFPALRCNNRRFPRCPDKLPHVELLHDREHVAQRDVEQESGREPGEHENKGDVH